MIRPKAFRRRRLLRFLIGLIGVHGIWDIPSELSVFLSFKNRVYREGKLRKVFQGADVAAVSAGFLYSVIYTLCITSFFNPEVVATGAKFGDVTPVSSGSEVKIVFLAKSKFRSDVK